MTFIERMVQRRRAVLATAILLAFGGVLAWMVMGRQEDPSMSPNWGMVRVTFPGADAPTVERLTVAPIERELAEVEDVKHVTATVRAGYVLLFVELFSDVDHGEAWADVSEALDRAYVEFPDGASEPELEQQETSTESVLLAVTGSNDTRELARAAERLEDVLVRLPDVKEVVVTADPGEQITIELDDAAARRYGIDARTIAGQLAQRNTGTPGGTLDVGGLSATLQPDAEIGGAGDVARMPVMLASGAAIELSEIARVRETVEEPESVRMRYDGVPAVAIGVVPRDGIHLVDFGDEVRAAVAGAAADVAPLRVTEITFQPEHVEARLSDLGKSLLVGILIVAGLLVVAMGARLGFLVAAIVPLVTLGALAIYFTAGGVLHQISIAAFVLALGMLVDNAIVVAESIQRRIDEGEPRVAAAVASVRELALPLGSATGTTVAAFLPMLLATGGTAEFTRSIPVIVILTLALSYAFALVVTPTLGAMFLRRGAARGGGVIERMSGRLGEIVVERKGFILVGAAVLVVASGMAASRVQTDFFPGAGRSELLVDVSLPEGAGVDAVDEVSRRVEAALAGRPEVRHVASFVGRPSPKFYYNIPAPSGSTHFAQILVLTRDRGAVEPLRDWVSAWAARELPEAQVIPRGIKQGPPIAAPVSLRLYGDDLGDLAAAADTVRRELRTIPGVRDVRHSMGLGVPAVSMEVDDAALARRGLSRNDLSLALLGHTRGLDVGMMRTGADPVPIRVRAPEGEDLPAERLALVDVTVPGRAPVSVAEVAQPTIEWQPAIIQRRDRRRMVTVDAELDDGVTYDSVVRSLDARLATVSLPDGVTFEQAGDAEGASEANGALARTLPLGLFLLVMILLAEFDSFRRVGIVLTTVPLAAVGVVPGLLIGDQPFGFMSTLGAIALIGIVVNNAIVLLDRIEALRHEGASVRDAVIDAVRIRTRPILLTTGTTVAGLIPLTVSSSPLWPPLAWAMISGLVGSTALTLLVVPALYQLLFDRPRFTLPRFFPRRAAMVATAIALGAAAIGTAATAEAQAQPAFDLHAAVQGDGTPLDGDRVATRAVATSPSVLEARAQAATAEAAASGAFVAVLPRLELSGRVARTGGASGAGFALLDPSDAERARALVAEVDDPEARALFAGLLDSAQGLSEVDFDTRGTHYGVRARVTQPLSALVLEILPAHEAATEDERAARLGIEVARNEVALLARETFYAFVRARGAVAVAERSLARAEAHRRDVAVLVDAGGAAPVDVALMDAQVAAAEGAVARARRGLAIATRALETVAHVDGARGIAVAEDVTRPLDPLDASERELLRRARESRPELAQLRHLARAHDRRATAASNSGLPSLFFDASVDYMNPNLRVVPVQDGFEPTWEVGLTLAWSPNDALTGHHRASASRAQAAAARARIAAVDDALAREVADAVASHEAARAELDAARAGITAAEVAHRARAAQLAAGQVVPRDLIDANLDLTRAHLALLDAGISARLAEARLRHTLGVS